MITEDDAETTRLRLGERVVGPELARSPMRRASTDSSTGKPESDVRTDANTATEIEREPRNDHYQHPVLVAMILAVLVSERYGMFLSIQRSPVSECHIRQSHHAS